MMWKLKGRIPNCDIIMMQIKGGCKREGILMSKLKGRMDG